MLSPTGHAVVAAVSLTGSTLSVVWFFKQAQRAKQREIRQRVHSEEDEGAKERPVDGVTHPHTYL